MTPAGFELGSGLRRRLESYYSARDHLGCVSERDDHSALYKEADVCNTNHESSHLNFTETIGTGKETLFLFIC